MATVPHDDRRPAATRLPPPVIALERVLREGLDGAPGRPSLEAAFARPETIQLELLVDATVAALADAAPVAADTVRPVRRAAARATFSLRRAADEATPAPAALGHADAALAEAMAEAAAAPLATANAVAVLWHVRLHVSAAAALAGEPTAGPPLLAAIGEARAWRQQRMAQWRAWSDARFSALACIEPLGDGRCRRLGYRFAGRDHPIRQLGDRRAHQGLAWQDFAHRRLGMLAAAGPTWNRLRQRVLA